MLGQPFCNIGNIFDAIASKPAKFLNDYRFFFRLTFWNSFTKEDGGKQVHIKSFSYARTDSFRWRKRRILTPQETVGGYKVISAAESLTLRIWFSVTGESFGSLNFQFRISSVCNGIMKYLVALYLRAPSTEEGWLSIAEKFESRWLHRNAIGAVDGKHVVIHIRNLWNVKSNY